MLKGLKIHSYIKLYISKLPNTQTHLRMDSDSNRIKLISFSSYTDFTPRAPNVSEMCQPNILKPLKAQVRWMPQRSSQLDELPVRIHHILK